MSLWPRGWPRRFGGRLWWNLAVVLLAWSVPWGVDTAEVVRTARRGVAGIEPDDAVTVAVQGLLLVIGVAILVTIVLVLLGELVLPLLRRPWVPRLLLVGLAVLAALVLPPVAGAATYPVLVLLPVHLAIALLWALPPARTAGGGGGGGGGSRPLPDPRDDEGPHGAPLPERERELVGV